MVDPSKSVFRNDMAMIIPPSPENRVENGNDRLLGIRLRLIEEVPGLAQYTFNVLPGGGYEQFLLVIPVLQDVLPEEVKAFRDMHDAGLFFTLSTTKNSCNGSILLGFSPLFPVSVVLQSAHSGRWEGILMRSG
jgi:hypothetical protein